MKNIVGRDFLISYPKFRVKFIIHTDASKMQLGRVISLMGNPLLFTHAN